MMPLGFLAALGFYMRVVYAQLGSPTAMSDWCSQIANKKLDIANHTTSPKLILLGGSATLFGVKASILERKLGVPVVNLATHAGLGMAYIQEFGKKALRPGDTVVIFPEFEQFNTGVGHASIWAGSFYVDYILARDPTYFRGLSPINQAELALMVPFKRLAKGLAGKVRPELPPKFEGYFTYDPSLVDSHGDMTGHLTERRPVSSPPRDLEQCRVLLDGLSQDAPGLPLMSEFCRWAKDHGIRVLFGFPNMTLQSGYNAPTALAVESQIREFFTGLGVPVIGRMHDTLTPPGDFFDTRYHLTDEASAQRTVRLATLLEPWFPSVVPPR